MRTSLHLQPGRKGTKQLLAPYGARLVCVRYRHDTQQKKRFKTVELIVAEWAWEPPVPQRPADQIVALRIGFAEVALRERVKQAGGTWNPRQKVWELCYGHVVALNLEARIVEYEATTYRDQD